MVEIAQLCGVRGTLCAGSCGSRAGVCNLYQVGWSDPHDLAALLIRGEDGWGAICWSNQRLVTGRLIGLLQLWAQHQMFTGIQVASISGAELVSLSNAVQTTVAV